MRAPLTSMICDQAAEFRATSRKAAGSSPSRSANTSPSASASRLRPRIRLTASLARPPSPTLPIRKYFGNSARSTDSISAAIEGSPPIRPTPSPRATCALVPDTGVSRKRKPRGVTRATSAAMRSGSQVEATSTIVFEFLAQRGQQAILDHILHLLGREHRDEDRIAGLRQLGDRRAGVPSSPSGGAPLMRAVFAASTS